IADFFAAPLTFGARFTNLSQNATGYLWDFGDGTTSTLENPHHLYAWPGGTFTVTLKAFNECDTVTKTIEVTVNREVGLDEFSVFEDVKMYPNPNNGSFNIDFVSKS